MRFDNSPAIWEGIGDLENAIIRVQRQLGIVSKDIRFGVVGGAEDDKVVLKRLKNDLHSLLASTFPKMVRLLASISGGLRQLESPFPHKNKDEKDSKRGEDEAWEEFGISPDNIKIEDVDEFPDMADIAEVWNDDCRDSTRDTDPLAMIDANINVDVQGAGIGHPSLIEGPISGTRNKRRKKPGPKSRIRQEEVTTTPAFVKRERKPNLKFMSSCKDGKEITPLSPFVLLIDDVKEKMNNIARRGDEGPLYQHRRQRISRKKPVKITDEDPDHSDNDQLADDCDSSGDEDFKPEINQPGCNDVEKSLSSDELDDTDISEDYEPPTKRANKRVTKTRKKRRTKLEMLEATDDGHSKESICSICSEVYPNKFKLKHHVLVRHPRSYFDLYGPQNTTAEEWMKSVNFLPDGTADDKFPFKCSICGRPYQWMAGVRDHIETHCGDADDKKYQCEHCGKVFYSQVTLRSHRRRHTADQASSEYRKHICTCCNKGFSSLKRLRIHEKKRQLAGTEGNTNTSKTMVCSICNKTLSSRTALKEHMRLHYGVKPLLCPHPGCGKRFSQQGALYNHFEGLHSETEKYHCTICGKKFRWRLCHTKHMDSHKGPTILCSLCPMMFIRKENLKKHVAAVHNQIRPHACHLCPKRFKQKTHLQYHLNTHSNPGGRKRGLNRVKEVC